MWPCDTATVFHHDPKLRHAFVNDFLLIQLTQASPKILPRECCLIRLIGNAHSTAQVDEFQCDALIGVKFGGDIEQQSGGFKMKINAQFVRCHHGVQAEFLDAQFL